MTVLYDGACPLCRREVAWYRRLEARCAIQWTDMAADDSPLPAGLTRGQALARLHVVLPDGGTRSGAAAFVALWLQIPRLRLLGRLAALPPLPWVLELGYRIFLRLRPRLQRTAAERAAVRLYPRWLERELRSDHAGETGAVAIYRGMLAVTRDSTLRRFALRHLRTELRHLRAVEEVLPPRGRSRLLGPWRLAGWLTGALPALSSRRAAVATVAAVETFVEQHYRAQIDRLDPRGRYGGLRALLERCRAEEIAHRDEAAQALDAPPGPILRVWLRLVGWGSAAAVAVARRV